MQHKTNPNPTSLGDAFQTGFYEGKSHQKEPIQPGFWLTLGFILGVTFILSLQVFMQYEPTEAPAIIPEPENICLNCGNGGSTSTGENGNGGSTSSIRPGYPNPEFQLR